jgi:CTP synthase
MMTTHPMAWLVAILSFLTLTHARVPPYTTLALPTLRGGASAGSGSSDTPEDTLAALVQECIDSNRKLVVVTGGVLSGIGKGVTASSIGVLFRAMGLRVTALKIDPYLNVDAGTMSPLEHGEVFVLDDGGETDLDLGNYERFLSVCLTSKSNLSTGKIYQSVIERERKGDYLGKTVQVVPHVSDAIQEWVLQVAQAPVTSFSTTTPRSTNSERPEICIIELGGTLGDIESMPFVEALRQLQENIGYKNMCFVHVSLVPVLGSPVPEQKTKPTQHSVQRMMQLGLRPDFLCCRGKLPLEESVTKKLSMFTSVPPQAIISLHDVSNIYRVPLMMMEQNLPTMLVQRLRIPGYYKQGEDYNTISKDICGLSKSKVIQEWTQLSNAVDEPESECTVALVAKYMDQGDAYLSVVKALTHSAIATRQRLKIEVIDSSDLEKEDGIALQKLLECDGVVVPGGFGERGFEGKIKAIQTAREMKMPFLGICLGMQGAVIEYARNVAHILGADSAEFKEDLTKDLEDVVIFMPEGDRERMGGTMRLGARETLLKKSSLARKLYGHERIMERHRHRYEINPAIVDKLEEAGLQFVGKNTDHSGERMEVVELPEHVHPYFVGAQFHPEFTSRPEKPNPLFLGLLQHIKTQKAASTSQ